MLYFVIQHQADTQDTLLTKAALYTLTVKWRQVVTNIGPSQAQSILRKQCQLFCQIKREATQALFPLPSLPLNNPECIVLTIS